MVHPGCRTRPHTETYFSLFDMTVRSNRIKCCWTAGSSWRSWPFFRQVYPNSEPCHLSRKKSMDHKLPRAHIFQTCLMFRLKDPTRGKMERRKAPVTGAESQGESTEGRLRELALKWFSETQAPLILHNGSFPDWFQGFIARKEAEDQLRDKELGCFLIRLSDRAIGYILSYKGRDRCRHFVINQNKAGQFIVSGDTETHDNLTDLIEYYKISPIEPFGEYLTCPCSEADNHELYDEIQFGQKGKPVLSVQAVKSIWNQRNEMSSEEPPPLPPKSNKKLHKLSSDSAFEKAVPLGKNCNQAPPTQHKKSPSLRNALSRSLEDKGTAHSQVLYAQINQSKLADKTQAPTSNKETPNRLKDQQGVGSVPIKNGRRTPSPPSSCIYSQAQEPKTVQSQASGPRPSDSTVYTELSLVECRSKSLPLLDDGSDDHHTYRLCTPPPTPAKLSPTIPSKSTYYTVPETYSLQDQHATYKLPPSVTLCSSSSLDKLFNNPLYQTVTRVCASQDTMSVSYKERSSHKALRASFPQALDEDPTYAQVPNETISNHLFSENTYEQIPDRHHKMSSEMQLNNTYETIPDKSSKQSESVWSLKNDKWRRFFPEYKKK